MIVNLIATFVVYLVSLILLPFLALVFKRIYGVGWRLFFVVAAIQGVVAFAMLVPVLADFPSAGAIVLPGVLAAAAAIFAVIGLVLYALLFFLVHRPNHWKRNSLWLTGLSVAALAVLIGPSLIARSGITTNVDLHGLVTDIDGLPVPSAEVHIANCPYVENPTPVTDEQGRFHVIANCRSYLIIDRIRNRDTGTDCESWFPGSSGDGLLVFDSFGAADLTRRPGWNRFPAEAPVVIPCVWHVPDSVRHRVGNLNEFPIDGRISTVSSPLDKRYLELTEGEQDGMLRVAFIADPGGPADEPATGRLQIRPIAGGIQRTDDNQPYNAAPADGYEPFVEVTLDDVSQGLDETFYFTADDRRIYGALRVSLDYSFDYSAQAHKLPLRARLDGYLNDGGSRVLLTHMAQY